MVTIQNSNRRIAINTLIVYIRMIVVTIVGLLSSRFVLQALGASDFGLYNVVASLIVIINVLSTAMQTTTRRFVNFEFGKKNGNPNEVFNVCLIIYIGLAIVLLIIAETVGIIYIDNFFNVPEGKLADAMFVFQVSTIVACFGWLNIPYQSLLNAYEKFSGIAIIDITTTIIKLALILLLLYYNGNALRLYAVMMSAVTIASFILYHLSCNRFCPDVIKLKFYRKSQYYKEIISFNNYTALGAGAMIVNHQGAAMTINYFFGTVINSAFAVASQVASFTTMFVNNLATAAAPQITQNYSSGEHDRSDYLNIKITKYTILMMIIFVFPLLAELDFILALWLKEVPPLTSIFCSWTLIRALVGSYSGTIPTMIQATGNIKIYQMINVGISVLPVVISCILYTLGFPPITIVVVSVVSDILFRISSLYILKALIDFKMAKFVCDAYLPTFYIAIIMFIIIYIYRNVNIEGAFAHICAFVSFAFLSTVLTYLIGLTSSERSFFVYKVKSYHRIKQ